jgi:hypothetical protein
LGEPFERAGIWWVEKDGKWLKWNPENEVWEEGGVLPPPPLKPDQEQRRRRFKRWWILANMLLAVAVVGSYFNLATQYMDCEESIGPRPPAHERFDLSDEEELEDQCKDDALDESVDPMLVLGFGLLGNIVVFGARWANRPKS